MADESLSSKKIVLAHTLLAVFCYIQFPIRPSRSSTTGSVFMQRKIPNLLLFPFLSSNQPRGHFFLSLSLSRLFLENCHYYIVDKSIFPVFTRTFYTHAHAHTQHCNIE